MSLFSGSPITGETSSTSTAQQPAWMQNAIFRAVQNTVNAGSLPYQPYQGQIVAGASPYTQAAWQQAANNQGSWAGAYDQAQGGLSNLAGQPGAGQAAQGYYNQQMGGLNSLAQRPGGQAIASPYLNQQASGLQNLMGGPTGTSAASPYFGQATNLFGRAAGQSQQAAGQPYTNQAGQTLNNIDYDAGANAYGRYANEALGQGGGLAQASPYLQQGASSAAGGINDYMNPYTQQVTDRIAQLGARNLSENLLPGVADSFIQAGQFGGSRMGEFGSRALRDTQEAILGQQASALQSGYESALGASQGDRSRQLQAGTAFGGLGDSQRDARLNAGSTFAGLGQQGNAQRINAAGQYGNLGQNMAGFAGQDAQNWANVGGALANIGQNAGALQQSDAASQRANLDAYGNVGQSMANYAGQDSDRLRNIYGDIGGIGTSMGNFAQGDQNARLAQYQAMMSGAEGRQALQQRDMTALGQAGAQQTAQQQAELNARRAEWERAQGYPQQQSAWTNEQLRNLQGMVPTVSSQFGTAPAGFNPSMANQIGGGLAGLGGLYESGIFNGIGDWFGGGGSGNNVSTGGSGWGDIVNTAGSIGDSLGWGFSKGGLVHYADGGLVDEEEEDELVETGVPEIVVTAQGPTPATDLQALLEQYSQPSPYEAEIAEARTRNAAAQAEFENALKARMASGAAQPSKAELYFKLMNSFLNTKSGNFSEGLGNAGLAAADFSAQKRTAADQQDQFALELQKFKAGQAKEDLTSLRTLAQEDRKDDRSVQAALLRQYLASGKPQSKWGKLATDAGLQSGTPEYAAFVKDGIKQELASGDFYKQAQLNLSNAIFEQNKAKSNYRPLTIEEVGAAGLPEGTVAQVNDAGEIDVIRQSPMSGKMPAALIKLESEDLNDLATASYATKDALAWKKLVEERKLQLGPIENVKSQARNLAGVSTPNSRNFAEFDTFLEKLRNDILMMAKGVQTEGDALRAYNIILKNKNDEKVVAVQLEKIAEQQARNAEIRKLQIQQRRRASGAPDFDESQFPGTNINVVKDRAEKKKKRFNPATGKVEEVQ